MDEYTPSEYVQHGVRNGKGDIYYDCTEIYVFTKEYTITSDDDVSVITLIKYDDVIKSTRMYPVDSFGKEYMALVADRENEKRCHFSSEHDVVNYKAYFSISLTNANTNPKDSRIEDIRPRKNLITQNSNDLTGTVMLFDKPSAVFCADKFESLKEHHVTQFLPTDTWSTEYTVPAFDVDVVNRPFDGKLLIVSNADNTIVNISGGFDAVHAIYNRGDRLEQEIDVGAAYRIKSSENIAVALYLYDPTDNTKSSFTLIPPVQNMHDTLVTSIPNKILSSDYGFDVTEIKTFIIDGSLNSGAITKAADDNDPFYRRVSLGNAGFEIAVVKAGTQKWFTVAGNSKSSVLQMVSE